MLGALRLAAGWLTPVMWLVPPALMLRDGPEGLWVGLVVALAPLVAVLVGAARAVREPEPEPPAHSGVLVAVAGLLIWANLSLAGDVAAAAGAPRWHGVVLAGGPALVLGLWRRASVAHVALVAVALVGVGAPLIALAQTSGVPPVRAWQTLAAEPAFRFAPGSAAVTEGRDVAAGSPGRIVALEEEQRVSAPAGGGVRVHTRDALREPHQDWKLTAGQALALRPGDRLEVEPGTRLRFEAGRRVPGAPTSGAEWAGGPPPMRPLARLELGLALVGGAVALFSEPRFVAPRRRTAAAGGAVLLAAFVWGQAWAIYGALQAPDVFLGGVTLARAVELPRLALGPAGSPLQLLFVVGLLAALAAASAILVARPGAGRSGGGDIGHDLGLWAAVFAGAGAAAQWAVDPWAITVWAVGLGAAALAVDAVAPASGPWAATAVAALGGAVFVALSVLRWAGPPSGAVVGALVAHPVCAALLASLALRLALGRRRRA